MPLQDSHCSRRSLHPSLPTVIIKNPGICKLTLVSKGKGLKIFKLRHTTGIICIQYQTIHAIKQYNSSAEIENT